jgi:ubiquinone/menaquinone biosynthesis C-methylase UbiE
MQNPKDIWNQEYKKKSFMTGEKVQKSVLNFAKFLKKEFGLRGKDLPFKGLTVLDLGAGEGKVSAYFAERGAKVVAIEISSVAHRQAKYKYSHLDIEFINDNFAKKLPFDSQYFDIVLDVTSSNSLSKQQRELYLEEVQRLLKFGGFFFVRALCLDGDSNAKKLLNKHPGTEYGTYILPEIGLQERVFTLKEF